MRPLVLRLTISMLVVLVIAAAAVAACGAVDEAGPESSAASTAKPTTARGTVIALYKAYSEGRGADASALLSSVPDLPSGDAQPASWRRDLRLDKVGKAVPDNAAGRPAYYQRLFDVREVCVEFYQAHDALTREKGNMIEWVMVGRETPDGPWRIIDVGTGP